MPCLFKTAVKSSGIEGKGFFSLEDIPKGAVYWVYEVAVVKLSAPGLSLAQCCHVTSIYGLT